MGGANEHPDWEYVGVAFYVLAIVVLAFLIVAPPILIPLGHRALRQGRIRRAGDLATVAGVSAGLLFLFTALVAPYLIAGHGDVRPIAAAFLIYPTALWFLARRLTRAIRAAQGA